MKEVEINNRLDISGVIFDIGHTLINYKNPLNWSSLYFDALYHMAEECQLSWDKSDYETTIKILEKYNTRLYPREKEYTDIQIFKEILESTNQEATLLHNVISSFFSFFQNESEPFEEVIEVLKKLKQQGILIAVLSDVAYGMSSARAFLDITSLLPYVDLAYTSIDIGYRKPNITGYQRILDEWNLPSKKVMYVGDEEKDVIGANALNLYSVLINRNSERKEYHQDFTISNLRELLEIVK